MNFKLLPVTATLMLVLGTVAHADGTIDTLDQHVRFSGFGALGVVHSDCVRRDFAKNVDTKLQLQQVTIDSLDDSASFAEIDPCVRVGDKANVLSLTMDFVF